MAQRQHEPSLDLINFEGLHTKMSPETVMARQLSYCVNMDFFEEYGSMTKMRGTKRILSSIYQESGAAKKITWGTFYKAQDLSGQIVRRNLLGAGTTIQRLDTDGSVTELESEQPDELFRTSAQLDRFLYITSQDPYVIGKRGDMLRYDGTNMRLWGLVAPGSQDTVIEPFSDKDDFTASQCTLADETTIAWDGTSTKMTKTAGGTTAYFEELDRAAGTFAVNTVTDDRCYMYVYIPREHYTKLATSGRAISIYLGSESDLSTKYYRYDFQIGRLIEGWNTLTMDFSTYPSGDYGTTVGVPDDTALKSLRFEVLTNNAGDAPVTYWDNLTTLDQGAPTPTFAGVGSVFTASSTSTWVYRCTFVDEAGNESNAGPLSVTADNTAGSTDYASIELTAVPVSSNPAVTRRKLYRTVAGGSAYLFLATINDNITTTYSDTTADTSLGTSEPPTLGALITDNSPPPNAGICAIWKRTAFLAGDPLNPSILYYSRYDILDAFPLVNALEFDERITGIYVTYVGIVVATENAYWRVISDNPDYVVDKVMEGMGCVGARACGPARVAGWIIDRDGMRLYDLQQAIKVSEVIRDKVDAFYKNDLEDTHSAHFKKNNTVLWFTKDANAVYSDIYSYQYQVDDIRKGKFGNIIPNPTSLNYMHTFELEDADGEPHIYACGDDGMVYEFFADDTYDWVDASGSVRAMTAEFHTTYMRLAAMESPLSKEGTTGRELEGTTGRVQPTFIELRAKEANQAAHTWTVTVESSDGPDSDGTSRHSVDIDFEFPAGVSLLRMPVPNLIPAEYIRVKVKNEELGKSLTVSGLKVYWHQKAGQFAVYGTPAGQN